MTEPEFAPLRGIESPLTRESAHHEMDEMISSFPNAQHKVGKPDARSGPFAASNSRGVVLKRRRSERIIGLFVPWSAVADRNHRPISEDVRTHEGQD
jgi:hypothetical protein